MKGSVFLIYPTGENDKIKGLSTNFPIWISSSEFVHAYALAGNAFCFPLSKLDGSGKRSFNKFQTRLLFVVNDQHG